MRQTLGYHLRRFGVPAIIVVIVGAIFLARGFEVVENPLIDLRFSSQTRSVGPDVVVVAIDPESLAALGAWPWPRAQHAQVIDRLHQLGAGLVAVDIDLSSTGDPADDAILSRTLARHGENTILAAFAQQQNPGAREPTRLLSQPLDIFRASGSIAAIVLRPDSDGLIRRMPLFEDTGRTFAPTFSTALATGTNAQPALFYMDLRYDPSTIPTLSYIDVLNGDVPAGMVRGRQVVIGATSSQLGTHIPVPRYRALPATLVHVLAAQSLLNDRALVRPTGLFTLVVTSILAFGLWHLTRDSRSIMRAALLCGAVIAGSLAASFAAYSAAPLLLDITPWMLTAFLVFIASTADLLHRERGRVVALSREQRSSSRFMQLVFNTIGEAVLTVDPVGEIRSANAAAQRMFGQSQRAMIGRNVHDFFPHQLNGGARGDNVTQQLASADGPTRHVARRANGTTFPVDAAARELTTGQPGFVITVEDLSEYVEAENQRDTIQRQLLDAMESFGEAFAMFDANDRLIVCNTAFQDLHRDTPDAASPGTTFAESLSMAIGSGLFLITPDEQQAWLSERQELVTGGIGRRTHTILLSGDRWLQAVNQKTSAGGFITILFDVTEAKRREQSLAQTKEEAEVANLAKSEFLANMSHELRTPLNAVIGFSEMMLQEIRGPIGNPDYITDVRAIHESANHLLAIINDILDLSRIEAGTLILDDQETHVRDLIDSACRLLDPSAKSIELKIDIDPHLPALWIDPRITKQIFINLLSNAIKFSHAGEPVSIKGHQLPSGDIEISITDTGIGIGKEHLDAVFEPFGQVENAMTRTHEGVGLGLPLSQMFCSTLGADLDFDSKPDEGTTVRVRFPSERIHQLDVAGE